MTTIYNRDLRKLKIDMKYSHVLCCILRKPLPHVQSQKYYWIRYNYKRNKNFQFQKILNKIYQLQTSQGIVFKVYIIVKLITKLSI